MSFDQTVNHLLKLTSVQAPNQDFIMAGIADYLGQRLDVSVSFIQDPPWPEREQLLINGEIQIGWICGWPYVREVTHHPAPFELLVAPVMQAPRYKMRPIYYSDVIVHRASGFHRFDDLRNATWAYNEPQSHSGYNLTRYHLSSIAETGGFFRSVVAAGSHQAALEMVLQRRIDASAIDSTVLELEYLNRPSIRQEIRIVEILGPSPIPPLVITCQFPADLQEQIKALLLEMHTDRTGREVLASGQINHFVKVTDQDYDPIRVMAREGSRIILDPMI
jgi:phosphonate transport system substrate-binding protein